MSTSVNKHLTRLLYAPCLLDNEYCDWLPGLNAFLCHAFIWLMAFQYDDSSVVLHLRSRGRVGGSTVDVPTDYLNEVEYDCCLFCGFCYCYNFTTNKSWHLTHLSMTDSELILCFKSTLDTTLLVWMNCRSEVCDPRKQDGWMKAQLRVNDCYVVEGNPANCILTISKSNLFTSSLVMRVACPLPPSPVWLYPHDASLPECALCCSVSR